jgi:hypothetical protein
MVAATSTPTPKIAKSDSEVAWMGVKIAGALGVEGTWAITPASGDPGEAFDGYVGGLLDSAPGTFPKVIAGAYAGYKLFAKLNKCAGEEATSIWLHCSPEVAEMLSWGLKLTGHEHLAMAASVGGILVEAFSGKAEDSVAASKPLPLALPRTSSEWKSSLFMSEPANNAATKRSVIDGNVGTVQES